MTQRASPTTMIPEIADAVELHTRGRTTTISHRGDEFHVHMVDPDWELSHIRTGLRLPDRLKHDERPIVMTTGSHHVQTYWVSGENGNQMHQVPWAWHIADERWIPLPDIFLLPPDTPPSLHATWNEVCIQCHVVRGQPGLDFRSGRYESKVAELGISCEACHGPGADHVRYYAERRASGSPLGVRNESKFIVHPEKLSHDLSAHVCGQCHSDFAIASDDFWKTGHPFQPGDDLLKTRLMPHPQPGMEAYWDDGTGRVGGREFTAMAQSKCYIDGQLSCLSCHSMHDSDPDDQLRRDLTGNAVCLQCHKSLAADVSAHTHHASDSSGSLCYNCHMPHSSFALMKSIRSHRIDSPTAVMTADHGRPNACNLCHLDRSLQWTATHLQEWFGHKPFTDSDRHAAVPMAVRLLLTGDAMQRAVTAAAFGRTEAMAASGSDWQPAVLAHLLNDPYAVVRYVAGRSLREYDAFGELQADFLDDASVRELSVSRALQRWVEAAHASVVAEFQKKMPPSLIEELWQSRNDRPVALPE